MNEKEMEAGKTLMGMGGKTNRQRVLPGVEPGLRLRWLGSRACFTFTVSHPLLASSAVGQDNRHSPGCHLQQPGGLAQKPQLR